MKHIIIVLLLCGMAFSRQYTCAYDSTKNYNKQVESCKLQIMRFECEQEGVSVWSTTTTDGNTLKADRISTNAHCQELGVNISTVALLPQKMVVTYTSFRYGDDVHEVTLDQWKDLEVASTKSKVSATKVTRDDSTTVAALDLDVQVDSREIKKKLKQWNNKAVRILNIMLE